MAFSLSYRLAPPSHLHSTRDRKKFERETLFIDYVRTCYYILVDRNTMELLSFYRRNEINVLKIYRHNDEKVARFVAEESRKIHRIHVTYRFVPILVHFCNGKSEKSVVC